MAGALAAAMPMRGQGCGDKAHAPGGAGRGRGRLTPILPQVARSAQARSLTRPEAFALQRSAASISREAIGPSLLISPA